MNISDGLKGLQQILNSSKVEAAAHKNTLAAQAAVGGNATLTSDQAHVSTAANLAKLASSLPDIRMDKVDAIQQALARGSYSVDPTVVASKLIDHMLQGS
jgi:flagellar biosynthesis anti-sigma factor FlgM